MIRDITIGRYYDSESVIHRMDPRTKLMGVLVYIFSLFLFYRHCIPSVSFRTIALIHSLLHNSRKDYVFLLLS